MSGGNGALTLGASYPSGGSGNGGESVAIADVNRDGKLDIVVANQCQVADSGCSFGSLGTLIGNGDGTFVSGPLQTVPDGNLYSLFLADVNGDGILDAVATDPNGVEVFLGKGDGSFVTPIVYAGVQSPGQNTSLALADLSIIQPGGATAQSAIFVNRAGTYLVSNSSANPAAGGQAIKLTTSASASYLTGITPTGSITYYDGTASLGTAALSGGTASLNISGLSAGVHTITAYYSGDAKFSAHYGTALLQVVTAPATLVSIAVTPANPSIAKGTTQQFTATGTYSDSSTANITSSVTWGSGTTATATISAGGLATGVAAGTSTINATSGTISGRRC